MKFSSFESFINFVNFLKYFKTPFLKFSLKFCILTRIRSVERGICPIAADCTVLLSWSRDPGHANVLETFVRDSGVTSRLSLEHACQI